MFNGLLLNEVMCSDVCVITGSHELTPYAQLDT